MLRKADRTQSRNQSSGYVLTFHTRRKAQDMKQNRKSMQRKTQVSALQILFAECHAYKKTSKAVDLTDTAIDNP